MYILVFFCLLQIWTMFSIFPPESLNSLGCQSRKCDIFQFVSLLAIIPVSCSLCPKDVTKHNIFHLVFYRRCRNCREQIRPFKATVCTESRFLRHPVIQDGRNICWKSRNILLKSQYNIRKFLKYKNIDKISINKREMEPWIKFPLCSL